MNIFANTFSTRLLRSRRACIQIYFTGIYHIACKQFSYQCKDRFDGSQGTPENDNASGHKDESIVSESLSEEHIHRQSLQEKALSFLDTVNEESLSPQHLDIHRAHVRALKAGDLLYVDPVTGFQVMSRLAHLTRGDCCGNACRHCPFGQKNAPETARRSYNSAFYD